MPVLGEVGEVEADSGRDEGGMLPGVLLGQDFLYPIIAS